MACHISIARDKPAIRKLAELAAAKQAIPWVRVYRLADFVFFDHRYHLMNQAKCQDCHGTVAEQDAVADELGATKMVFCQGWHAKMHASGGCTTWHNTRYLLSLAQCRSKSAPSRARLGMKPTAYRAATAREFGADV